MKKLRDELAASRRRERDLKKELTTMEKTSESQRKEMVDRMAKTEPFDPTVFLQVTELSKKLVFRTHKFFTRQEDVDDYSEKHSPGALIMDKLHIPPERRAPFWNQYKMAMLEGVNQQRQNTQTSIGAKLKGKMC